jgi:transcriptional regulator with XRE-family HTH domain
MEELKKSMNDRLIEAFIQRFREVGISMNELSRRTGLSLRNIIYIIRGQNTNTRIGTIQRLYDELGLDIQIIQKDEEKKNSSSSQRE